MSCENPLLTGIPVSRVLWFRSCSLGEALLLCAFHCVTAQLPPVRGSAVRGWQLPLAQACLCSLHTTAASAVTLDVFDTGSDCSVRPSLSQRTTMAALLPLVKHHVQVLLSQRSWCAREFTPCTALSHRQSPALQLLSSFYSETQIPHKKQPPMCENVTPSPSPSKRDL